LPATFIVTAAAVYYGELHLAARNITVSEIPVLPEPAVGDRILIVSPHPDDESLGCAGLIRRAVARGSEVHVAILTNGEAFRESAMWEQRKIDLSADDLREYARTRRSESEEATSSLGVPRQHLHFLNYPDRGLAALFDENWSAPVPPRLRQNGAVLTPVGPNTGDALTHDLAELIFQIRPTHIYVTHPLDDHVDHAFAFAFVQAAMLQTGAHQPVLRTYMIHRGDWPIPQGYEPSEPLRPQFGFADRALFTLPLIAEEELEKERAIGKYATQLPILGRFMRSFIRTNELFSDAPKPPLAPKRTIQMGSPSDNWAGLEPVATEPAADTLQRNVAPGLDLWAIYVAVDDTTLQLRFDFGGRIARSGEYSVTVRGFDGRGKSVGVYSQTLVPNRSHRGIRVYWKGNVLEWAVPRSIFPHAATVAAYMETSVDRSAVQFIRLPH